MRYILILLVVFITTVNAYSLQDDWNSMSSEEKLVIKNSYYIGKRYGVGLSLAAIAWQESKGGRWQIGTVSDDYGVYHINIYWYLKEIGVPVTRWNKSKYATIIMTDPKLAQTYVITKLVNLKLAYKRWMLVWEKYNGSKEYAYHILKKVRFLRKKFN